METQIILLVGSILLAGGCFGLLVVRLSNPFLKGVGWLGAAFACGALGATAFAVDINRAADSLILVADAMILLAFVFLHVCTLEVTDSESRLPRLGIVLLMLQAAVFPVFQYLGSVDHLCAVMLGVLVSVQAVETAWLLKKNVNAEMRVPIWFNVSLLLGFAIFNVSRSVIIVAAGTLNHPQLPNPLEAATAIIFLGVGLGLGFGVFWMEGHQIRLQLQRLANVDPLTGIYNRRSFIALCEQELLRTSRSGEVFSLIMFDLDHFKNINDRYGHRVGDEVLCAVVEKLRNSVRNIDIVGRWGGEEFVALLPKADADAALIVARRLRYHVDSIAMTSPLVADTGAGNTIRVTLSIGVATYRGHASTNTIHDLLDECDTAMYQAKLDGRNRIVSIDAQLALSH